MRLAERGVSCVVPLRSSWSTVLAQLVKVRVGRRTVRLSPKSMKWSGAEDSVQLAMSNVAARMRRTAWGVDLKSSWGLFNIIFNYFM